jgi:hypothetical protein
MKATASALWVGGCCALAVAEELMRHGGFLLPDRPNGYARVVSLVTLVAITLLVLAGSRFSRRWISALAVAVTLLLFRVVRYNIGTFELPIDFKWLLVYTPPWVYGVAVLLFASVPLVARAAPRVCGTVEDVER